MFQVELFILMLMFLVYFITLYILKRNKNGIKLKYKIDSDLNNVDNYKITIFVPARNEQYSIGKTLECLSKLKSNNYKVVIIDDHSTDNTAIEIEKKKNLFKSDQLIIFTPPEPAKGWLGKTNALNKATSMHKSSNADFFLFIDADVHVKNDILQKLVYIQQKEKADMVSINPFFTSNSFWTKIMSAPIMLMLVLSILHPNNTSMKKKVSTSHAAYGGCIFIKKDCYFKIGGHESVKNLILEDMGLADKVSKDHATVYRKNENMFTINMYPTIKDFYNGLDKHTKGQMQIKGLTFKLTFIPILLLIPLVVMFFGIFNIIDHSYNLFIFGFILYLFVVLLNMMVKEYYDSNILYCFCYPFALLIFFYGITIKSFPKLIHKSRVSWRGRIYNI